MGLKGPKDKRQQRFNAGPLKNIHRRQPVVEQPYREQGRKDGGK